MRITEVRRRYTAKSAKAGETMLFWRAGAGGAAPRERLFPSLASALEAARARLDDLRCHDVLLYDGRRLYDREAIALRTRPAAATRTGPVVPRNKLAR